MDNTRMDSEPTIPASRFKAQCLAILDRVERTRAAVVVTKHGRPVARVVPVEAGPGHRDTRGSVQLLVREDEAYYGTGEEWEADKPAR
jgi:prevent-host-death family protein